MTPEQIAISKYLIEYRNPDGSLLLPQFGGCWHNKTKPFGGIMICRKCESYLTNPNLFTPEGFFALWQAMQAREDWQDFATEAWNSLDFESDSDGLSRIVNPLTIPYTVEAYLKGLER